VTGIPQLSQRVKLFFHLEGLTAVETAEYIDYRLLVSGHGGNKLFDDETVQEIHKLSHGIPRLINKLCDGMMMCAYAEDRPFIDPYDLQGIRKDLLGEDVPDKASKARTARKPQTSSHRDQRGPKQEQPQVRRNRAEDSHSSGSADVLMRIAEALESIDGRLAQLTTERRSAKDEPSSSSNVKPLNPGRK